MLCLVTQRRVGADPIGIFYLVAQETSGELYLVTQGRVGGEPVGNVTW